VRGGEQCDPHGFEEDRSCNAIVASAFGLWKMRSIVILLLLELTFAAAIRAGVEWPIGRLT
jgi:hypothetical protein